MSKILIAPTIFITNSAQVPYLYESVDSFISQEHELDLIGFCTRCDIYRRDIFNLFDRVYFNDINCLSRSWNKAISWGLKKSYDYILIPNLDVKYDSNCVDRLVNYANRDDDSIMWSPYCVNHKHINKPNASYKVASTGEGNYDTYASFMVNHKLFKRVGRFDEYYQPAYCEDIDMEYRISLSNNAHMVVRDAEFEHYESVTIRQGNDDRFEHYIRFANPSIRHFQKKWGGQPRCQTYLHPFNNSSLDYKFTGDYGEDDNQIN